MIIYRHPPGVQASNLMGRDLLSTPHGGNVAVDSILLSLWESADGRGINDVLANFRSSIFKEDEIRAGLACLAEAGLLVRDGWVSDTYDLQVNLESPANNNLVSVIVVNHNSQEWLEDCISSLEEQTHSDLEMILVDNGSEADPSTWLRKTHPAIVPLRLDEPVALSAAINFGIVHSSGQYYLSLNPDVRLKRDAVAQMVAVAEGDPECAVVAAKLKYSWAPAFLNGVGNWVGPFSWGTDIGLGQLDLGQFDSMREVPSACFAAALIPRKVWELVGPLDEGFPLYYEDLEWSYRARILGYKALAASRSVVYHAMGRQVHTGEDDHLTPSKLRNVVYGRLRFAAKLLGPLYSLRFLRNYGVEDTLRVFHSLVVARWGDIGAIFSAWWRFLRSISEIYVARRGVQSERVIDDEDLFAIQRGVPKPLIWRGLPELTMDLVSSYYLPIIKAGTSRSMPEFEDGGRRKKLLIVSNEIVDLKMAGPGMRYLEMARALCKDMDVHLAIPGETSLEEDRIRFLSYDESHPASLHKLVEAYDVALITPFILHKVPTLDDVHTRLVVDLYDPFIFENLYYYLKEPMGVQLEFNRGSLQALNRAAQVGDFFICGSERQRDFWIGVLAANERINPYTFAQDADLRDLIDVVSIGFPERAPRSHKFLRGVHPNFPEDSLIVLWGGGVWNWMDPLSLVRAWPQVLENHPKARLVILGTRHPNPDVPPHRVAGELENLARELGERDRTIFFFEWLDFEDREALLSEADVGVSLHPQHVETRFSIRTRVLDYLWAKLPVLASGGDVTSNWVSSHELGVVVPPGDVNAVARGLNELLSKPKEAWLDAFLPLYERFNWSRVVEPLRHYCLTGEAAPDHTARGERQVETKLRDSWTGWLARARTIWRLQGGRMLLHRVWRYLQNRLTRML